MSNPPPAGTQRGQGGEPGAGPRFPPPGQAVCVAAAGHPRLAADGAAANLRAHAETTRGTGDAQLRH